MSDYPITSPKTEHNTRISFLYRDADNYKIFSECIITGRLTTAQKSVILSCLDEGEYFLPDKVGLQGKTFTDLGYAYDPQSDHPWFELDKNSFEPTDLPPTVAITADQLTTAFIRCKDCWLSITPEEALAMNTEGQKPALASVIRTAQEKSGNASLNQGKTISLSSFLAAFDFEYRIYPKDDPSEIAIRKQLIEDGKLEECHLDQPLLGFVDQQGANFGEIEGERFVLDSSIATKIIDRLEIYIEDGVISEFKDAVKEYGFNPSKHSLEEMILICKAHFEEGVSYTLAQAILSPEKINLAELYRDTKAIEAPAMQRD